MRTDNNNILDNRLGAVADLIRQDAVLCDVGTDHAKLPIALVECGKIRRGYATDINKGPIMSAEKNIAEKGLTEHITTILTDGLHNTDGLGITDVSVCGMGGELICRILDECEYLKDENINLVLQPMTHVEDVRKFMFDNGFTIVDEVLVEEQGRIYTIIAAHYTSVVLEYDDLDLMIGKILPIKYKDNELFCRMCGMLNYHLENKKKSADPFLIAKADENIRALREVLK